MSNILIVAIYLIVMIAIAIGILTLLKKFVFPKVRINKYIPLGISIAAFLVQMFGKFTNTFVNTGIMIVVVIFFSWYLDINQTGGPKKSTKKVVIKAKAKPNRLKNKK